MYYLDIVKKQDFVKKVLLCILLVLGSKITADLVKKLDLVNILLPPRNFTTSGLYCAMLIHYSRQMKEFASNNRFSPNFKDL